MEKIIPHLDWGLNILNETTNYSNDDELHE